VRCSALAERLLDETSVREQQAADAAAFLANAHTALAAATAAAAIAAARLPQPINLQSQAMIQAANVAQINGEHQTQATTATAAFEAEIRRSAEASVADAANKQALSAQTQLLQVQTDAAAEAFFKLHPGIGAAGIAALAAAGQIGGVLNPALLQDRLLADQATPHSSAFRRRCRPEAPRRLAASTLARTSRPLAGYRGDWAAVQAGNYSRSSRSKTTSSKRSSNWSCRAPKPPRSGSPSSSASKC
jgi:hypothetical protein